MSNLWFVRPEGSTHAGVEFPNPQAVADALRDGEISPSDEVRAPGEATYRPLDMHPVFEELAEELEAPLGEADEETHLDMNPLIDVSLVLLIFFILTATYSTLVRSLDVPAEPPGGQGAKVTRESIRERSVTVGAKLENGQPAISVEGKPVKLDDLEAELKAISKAGNRQEAYLDVAPDVPWAVTARLFEAARGADVQRIYFRSRK